MRNVEEKTSALLVIAALTSYAFYMFHSVAVRGFISELSRLARKFVLSN